MLKVNKPGTGLDPVSLPPFLNAAQVGDEQRPGVRDRVSQRGLGAPKIAAGGRNAVDTSAMPAT